MKKVLAIAVMLLMTAVAVDAKVKFGVRGGYNITQFSFDSSVMDDANKAGFYIGPTVKIGLPIIDLDLAALYDQRDAKVVGETVSKKYVDVQLNVRKGFGLGDKASFFLFAGPQLGFNIGNREEFNNEGHKFNWKDSDFSVNVGAGIMALDKLELKVNYNIACGNSGELSVESAGKAFDTKDNAWQIGLAYYF